MHFYVFTDGKPLEVHKFPNITPGSEQFEVWTPPVREKPYLWEGEHFYGIMFLVDKAQGSDKPSAQRKMLKMVLDLAFNKPEDNYPRMVRDLIPLFPDYFIVITDRGIRSRHSVILSGCGLKRDSVLTVQSQAVATQCFMNIVHKNLTKKDLTTQEAFQNAFNTGIFDESEYYYAQVPKWYTFAQEHYGPSDDATVTRARLEFD
jgi:hypothetical protein